MIIAAKKYDSSKESKFVTYAIWWIDQRILREIMDYGFTIRIPVHVFESISKILRAFNNNLGCSKDEVFEILQPHGFSREQFEFLMNLASNILSIASLNTYVGENEDSELYEFIVDESRTSTEDEVYMAALKHKVSEVLKTLTPREQKVINLRFGIEDDRKRTLEEIGDEFNVTRERIRQIEANALKKLRHPTRSRLLRDFIGG
jgi:RNA polymerase primary sigma factor